MSLLIGCFTMGMSKSNHSVHGNFGPAIVTPVRDVIFRLLKMGDKGGEIERRRSEPHSTLSCYALRLNPGQEMRQCLLQYVRDNKLKAPFVLSCVGSVTQATLRLANASKETVGEIIEVRGRHEIVSLVGTLAGAGHLHASLADKDGHVLGGHVIGNMKVFTTAEVVIGNCDMLSFTREMDDETGFDELVVKQK